VAWLTYPLWTSQPRVGGEVAELKDPGLRALRTVVRFTSVFSGAVMEVGAARGCQSGLPEHEQLDLDLAADGDAIALHHRLPTLQPRSRLACIDRSTMVMIRPMPKLPSQASSRRQLALRSLADARVVGRDEEMLSVAAALRKAALGFGCAIFVSGEPGIGKSRLAAEAARLARAQGFIELRARGHPLEDSLAYGMFTDAIAGYLRSIPDGDRSALLREVPILGSLVGSGEGPDLQLADPGLTRAWLLDAIARFVGRLSTSAPVIFVLDDLHLADASSRQAVHYLVRRIAEQPVLLLATHRSEAAATRPLIPLMLSLKKQQGITEIRLGRLPGEAVRQLVAATLGVEGPRALLELLESRAAGTPLFVETILRELLTGEHLHYGEQGWLFDERAADILPDEVRDVVLEQLARLTPKARQVVDLLAVVGEPLSGAALEASTRLGPNALSGALANAVEMGLVAEHTGTEISFGISHPLIQEAAYLDVPESARRLVHASLVTFFEENLESVDRLARHYRAAGSLVDRSRAVKALVAAGERARGLNATYEASQHFSAALEMVGSSSDSKLRARLLERLGELEDLKGNSSSAVRLLGEALEAHRQMSDWGSFARVSAALAITECDRGDLTVGKAHLDAGLASLSGRPPTQNLADLRHAEVRILTRLGDFEVAAKVARDLVDLSTHLGSHRAVAEAHLAAAGVHLAAPDYDRVRASLETALDESEQGAEPLLVLRARHLLALTALTLGEHAAATLHSKAAISVARQLRSPVLELNPMATAAEADFLAGRWPDALEHSREALAMARQLDRPRVVAWMLAVRASTQSLLGDFDAARSCIAEARETFPALGEDRNIQVQADMAEAVLALERRSRLPTRALSLRIGVVPATMLPARLALAGEAAVQWGHLDEAEQIADQLEDISGGEYPRALAARLRGLIAISRPDLPRAALELETAIEVFGRLDLPFEQARARMNLGMLLDGRGGRTHLLQASQEFERLGAPTYLGQARSALRGLRTDLDLDLEPQGQPLRAWMTPREIDVARLVADGLTNPEVAGELNISQRTVTTHLTNIYERTGLRSRTALARYVFETGLGSGSVR